MLGMRPWSSARAVSVLDQGDISSVHLAWLSEDKKIITKYSGERKTQIF